MRARPYGSGIKFSNGLRVIYMGLQYMLETTTHIVNDLSIFPCHVCWHSTIRIHALVREETSEEIYVSLSDKERNSNDFDFSQTCLRVS